MENKRKEKGSGVQGREDLEIFFLVYALRATCFSLRIRHGSPRKIQRHVSCSVTAHTPLIIYPLKPPNFRMAILRGSPRAFGPKCFLY